MNERAKSGSTIVRHDSDSAEQWIGKSLDKLVENNTPGQNVGRVWRENLRSDHAKRHTIFFSPNITLLLV